MFLSFKHKAKEAQHSQNAFQDKIAAGIVQHCVRIQSRWAGYMQRRTEGLSKTGKQYCLVFFCLLAGGCSFYFMASSFYNGNSNALHFTSTKVPQHVGKPIKDDKEVLIITQEQHQKIKWFRQYMDSLGRSTTGKSVRDSMLLFRPGLMDSIRVIEQLYKIQSSKK